MRVLFVQSATDRQVSQSVSQSVRSATRPERDPRLHASRMNGEQPKSEKGEGRVGIPNDLILLTILNHTTIKAAIILIAKHDARSEEEG